MATNAEGRTMTKITIKGLRIVDVAGELGSSLDVTTTYTCQGRGKEPSVTIVECGSPDAVRAVEELCEGDDAIASYRQEAV